MLKQESVSSGLVVQRKTFFFLWCGKIKIVQMENPEGVLNLLDEFAKLKSKEIPNDLEEYLLYVAASGDPVYQWSLIKSLYRQKLINVITEFYEMCPVMDIPRCPNVDPFNYETMKNSLLKRLDSFSSAPFTIQRISELLTTPRKQYNRVDKFMRAIEKNIWVVSTREPGPRESTNPQETSTNLVNGVTPRVCVTVKHPKRVKSIEERIKSGHPQLIDDEDDDEDEEEEEEEEEIEDFEQIEEENNTEMLQNNEPEDSSLQCTSVKDLIEKYENGTIFSNTEEKSDFEEKSIHIEETGMETETTDTTLIPPTSSLSPSNESKEGVSNKEALSDTMVSGSKEEAIEPAVAADSSSDLPAQESETAETVSAEMSVLDSTSNVSVEESEQIVVESSTSTSTDIAFSENNAALIMINTPSETSGSDKLPLTPTPNEKIHPVPESSSDSVTVEEFLSNEIDPVNKADENEQVREFN